MALRLLVSFHLVGVVLWMGGLLNLSRILGYHAREHPSVRPRYAWLEGRLNYLVTIPGAVLTLGTGVAQAILLGAGDFRAARWLHYKLALVATITILHVVITVKQRRIAAAAADAPINRKAFAALHGTLGLLLIGVILLAVTKRPVLSVP
jgi:protoporphyrinogen IX oxidase